MKGLLRISVMIATFGLVGLFAAPVDAAGPAVSISLTPTSASLTADATQAFTVIATDGDNQQRDVTAETTFSMNDPLGSMTGAVYNPGRAGTWTVQANYQSFTATASVTVTAGALTEIIVNPNSDPEFVNVGAKKTFTAKGYDAASNEVALANVSWSVIGEIGTIASNGVFSAVKVGTGKVSATSGGTTTEIAVVVKTAEAEPVNANTNAATNTNSGVNANGNVNAATNTNSGVNANGNVNAATNTNTAAPISTDDNVDRCTTLSTWVWVLILVVFLIGLAVLYALVPVTKIWPAAIGLGGAIALVIVHQTYACGVMAWWPWVVSLGALGLTVLALRQMPATKQSS